MQVDIDIEKIRKLVIKVRNKTVLYDREAMRHKCDIFVSEIRNCASEALSLLPKPCEICGGSGKKIVIKHQVPCEVPCPDCQEPNVLDYPIPKGFSLIKADSFMGKVYDDYIKWLEKKDEQQKTLEALAGEVEEFVKELRKDIEDVIAAYPIIQWSHSLPAIFRLTQTLHLLAQKTTKACSHLTTLLKQITRLEGEIEKYRWIPVSERLPELPVSIHNESSELLWLIAKDKSCQGYYNNFGGWRICGRYQNSSEYQREVTHWKPIILPDQALKGE